MLRQRRLHKKREPEGTVVGDYEYFPTGRLRLRITDPCCEPGSCWDSDLRPIEERLNEFVAAMVAAALRMNVRSEMHRKAEEQRRAEEDARRAEVERRRLEAERLATLRRLAAEWASPAPMRGFVAAVRSEAERRPEGMTGRSQPGSNGPSEPLRKPRTGTRRLTRLVSCCGRLSGIGRSLPEAGVNGLRWGEEFRQNIRARQP